ncbi:Transmembrane protein 97 [Rhynchospora pubera]|uniref:Transmembrane protein 97 n=1 Tax=Rhynchospora pubera TaxID=906938 RepID=A0AAV8GCN9_9POAL|nr:Transmembrane protein 97 [Rhynchospora pubera]
MFSYFSSSFSLPVTHSKNQNSKIKIKEPHLSSKISNFKMGAISILLDTVVFIFSLVIAIATPLLDSQSCLPSHIFPAPLVDLKKWYADLYGDYLVTEKPHFFVGLIWVEIFFLWPVCVANLYGIVKGRGWSRTTSLMAGVCAGTSMAAIMAEVLRSGRASEKLIQMYSPFGAFAVCAILRGLLPRPRKTSLPSASHGYSARKKRA